MRKKSLIFLAAAAMLAACTKEPASPDPENGTPGNTEIYKIMSENYLYNEGFPPSGIDYSKSNDEFFNSLLSASPQNNDGKHPGKDGSSYFYSYMEHTTKTRSAVPESSYGMGYVLYKFNSGAGTTYMARVLYVIPNSAVQRAGIKRGEWISEINGIKVTENNINALKGGGAATLTVCICEPDPAGRLAIQSKRTVQVAAAVALEISPVYNVSIITSQRGDKVGYFHYLEFRTGPASEDYDPTNGTYVNAMRDAFTLFKSNRITDLVVDLRYNPGGYVECCRLLSSMIADRNALGKLFLTARHNSSKSPEEYRFMTIGDVPQNLSLGRVYVLVSDLTASASELLISTLQPYMNVRVIGVTTEGKNVGSNAYSIPKYQLELHPITFQSYNARGESDNYKNGFQPDITADDLDDLRSMKELGDPEELLLKIALGEIAGTAPVSAFSKGGAQRDFKVVGYGTTESIRGMILK